MKYTFLDLGNIFDHQCRIDFAARFIHYLGDTLRFLFPSLCSLNLPLKTILVEAERGAIQSDCFKVELPGEALTSEGLC